MERFEIGERLVLDLATETWRCWTCGHELGPAGGSYRAGCLVRDRDPRELDLPLVTGLQPGDDELDWTRILEFSCPACDTRIETDYVPPGEPVSLEVTLDIDLGALRRARSSAR